jgi:hypothetical protein
VLRVQAIDDRSCRRIKAAPEAERLVELQNESRRGTGNKGHGIKHTPVHRRITLPARAEATHSASDPYAIATPRLPGA